MCHTFGGSGGQVCTAPGSRPPPERATLQPGHACLWFEGALHCVEVREGAWRCVGVREGRSLVGWSCSVRWKNCTTQLYEYEPRFLV